MRRAGLLAAVFIPLAAQAADDGPGLLADFSLSRDSEQFEISTASAGFAPYYVTQDRLAGVLTRQLRYSQPGWSRDGEQVSLQDRRKSRNGWQQLEINATHLGRSSVGGSFTRGWFDDTGRSSEVFAERNLVDSQRAIDKDIAATLIGAAVDIPLDEFAAASGYAAVQYIEDNNWRSHIRLKLSLELNPAPATAQLQARVRSIHASRPFTGNYYNPKAFEEVLFGLFLRFDHQDWRFNLWAGAGPQRADAVTRTAYVIEARLQTPRLAEVPVHASLTVGARRDGARESGYSYRYIMGNIGYRY